MKKALDILTKIYRTIIVVLAVIIVLLCAYEVVGRHLFFLGLNTSWTEEAMRYIYVGIIMLGLACVTRQESFTSVTSISDLITRHSKIGGEILYVFQSLVHIACFALLFWFGLKLDLSAGNRVAATTRIPFNIIYAPIPIGAFLATVIRIVQMAEHFTAQNKKELQGGDQA